MYKMIIGKNATKEITAALQKGERIKLILGFKDAYDDTAFCEDCGLQWAARIEERLLTNLEIEQECRDRGISKKTIENVKNRKKALKEERRKAKKKRREQKRSMQTENIDTDIDQTIDIQQEKSNPNVANIWDD